MRGNWLLATAVAAAVGVVAWLLVGQGAGERRAVLPVPGEVQAPAAERVVPLASRSEPAAGSGERVDAGAADEVDVLAAEAVASTVATDGTPEAPRAGVVGFVVPRAPLAEDLPADGRLHVVEARQRLRELLVNDVPQDVGEQSDGTFVRETRLRVLDGYRGSAFVRRYHEFREVQRLEGADPGVAAMFPPGLPTARVESRRVLFTAVPPDYETFDRQLFGEQGAAHLELPYLRAKHGLDELLPRGVVRGVTYPIAIEHLAAVLDPGGLPSWPVKGGEATWIQPFALLTHHAAAAALEGRFTGRVVQMPDEHESRMRVELAADASGKSDITTLWRDLAERLGTGGLAAVPRFVGLSSNYVLEGSLTWRGTRVEKLELRGTHDWTIEQHFEPPEGTTGEAVRVTYSVGGPLVASVEPWLDAPAAMSSDPNDR